MIEAFTQQRTIGKFTFMDYKGSNLMNTVNQEINNKFPGADIGSYVFPEGSTIVDVGANIGMISIMIARQNPTCTVYAFEPMPMTYAYLAQNIHLNGTYNVLPFQMGVAGVSKVAVIRGVLDNNSGGSTMWSKSAQNPVQNWDQHVSRVLCVTPDEILKIAGYPEEIAFLKIDCEGSEHEIVEKAHLNTAFWSSVKRCEGELHENQILRDLGYSNGDTETKIASLVSGPIRFHSILVGKFRS